MKIQIDAKELEEVIKTSAQAISSRPINAESECVYLEVSSEKGVPAMLAQAKDSGIIIRKTTDRLTVIEDGYALIPAKTILAFLKLMDGDVTLTVDDNLKCTVKCGGKKSVIACLDAEDYVADFTFLRDEKTVKMNGVDFERIVLSTAHCVSTDQGRLILTGINFAFDSVSGICEGTAISGFTLAQLKAKAETNDSFNVTIPATTAKLIAKCISGKEGVSFRFSNGLMIVEAYDITIQAPLLSGQYMDVPKFIMRTGKMNVKANAQDMLEAVRMALIAAQGADKWLIVLNFDKEDTMTVNARCVQTEADADIGCDVIGEMEGGAKEIAFNGVYLESALKASLEYGEEVSLLMNTTSTLMAITPLGNNDFYQMVLPVRRL